MSEDFPPTGEERVATGTWARDVALLVVVQLTLGLVCLKTVPRVYNDDAWEASLGYCLAYDGSLRHGIIEGWGGLHVHFVQNQVIQPLLLAGIYRVFGFGLYASRVASVLMGMVAVAAVYGVMRAWLGRRPALWVALFTLMHPWFFELSRRVRPDIFVIALAWSALWVWVGRADRRPRFAAVGAGVTAALAALAHPTGLVLVAALIGGVLCWMRPTRFRALVIWGLPAFLVTLLPYVGYVLWAAQDPEVRFFEQMRGGKPVVSTGLSVIVTGELQRWRHFLQWPKGAPLGAVIVIAWLAGWVCSTRRDKAMATCIVLFAVAMPFTTVNNTSRYLAGLIPLMAALAVRMGERLLAGRRAGDRWAGRWRLGLVAGVVVLYVGMSAAGIGLMICRVRNADLDRVAARISAMTGPEAKVYGEQLFWLVQEGRFRYGPYPLDYRWQATVEDVGRHGFDYAVRTAWKFEASRGIDVPPTSMPAWRPDYIVDQVCRQRGSLVASFRDPDFGPIEVYRLRWDDPNGGGSAPASGAADERS
ncbi:MAG TPA: glycosyltransferase family 39 protein [Phycisphaerae bacterium]|nr:glycosyltransferase family 39 protein [Phycisphaerae bacterium]HRY66814.1 glycosyltransferase family 39 protein [Phycisphaerae bacterium]HSA26872.1 glycosyltransferase family 39 protein [Phycisphaerae bacterium]